MGIIFGTILILMGSSSFCYLLNKKLVFTIPLFVLSLISFLYFFGLFTILDIGIYISIALILGLFTFSAIEFFRNKKYKTIKINYHITIIFICFVFINLFIMKNVQIDNWDEFSHWATIVKNMFLEGNFGNLNNIVLFPGYPPATGIFHCFFQVLGGRFIEKYLYVSMNILNFSLIIPVFSQLKKGATWRNIVIVFFALFLPCVFDADYYMSLYIDIYLGILFAYIIYIYFFDKKLSYFKLANISLGIFVLTISKASGLGLGLIALIIIGIDLLVAQKRRIKKIFTNKFKYLLFLIPITSLLVANFSWSIYLNIFNLNVAWSTSNLTLRNVLSFIHSPTKFESQVTTYFISSLFKNMVQGIINLNPVVWCIIILVLTFFILCWNGNKKRSLSFSISLGFGFIGYAVTLLLLYLFTYSEYEALTLASFSRYISTYITALILILFYAISHKSNIIEEQPNISIKKIKNIVISIVSCISISIIPFASILNGILFRQHTRNYYKTNNSLGDFKEFCYTLNPETDKIYYIYTNSTGETYYRAIYYALPIKINITTQIGSFSWSLGPPRYEGDVWSLNVSSKEWEKILIEHNFTHIYIDNTDDIFINTYSSMFENKEDIVNDSGFKIIIQEDSSIKFRKI